MKLGAMFLLTNAAMLGFRHGIDWDHIAAIMDIVGTTTNTQAAQQESFVRLQKRALGLSSLYALGHASVVALLGVAALSFAAFLPKCVGPIMERIVGATLLVLGAWVFYSLIRSFQGKTEFELKSRWMLIFAVIRHSWDRLCSCLLGRTPEPLAIKQYGPHTAFGVGVLHGIGAETGTQILLIAAIGGAASQGLGLSMLISFVLGLVISNTLLAVLGAIGFTSSARLRPLYVTAGIMAGAFSLVVGFFFASGQAQALPELHRLLGS